MRHQKQKNSSFSRHRGPRKALIRGLIHSLVEHERIKTTLPKARTVRPLMEKAITMGKKGTLQTRRVLLSRYPNKSTVNKIISTLSPRFKYRPGGYTRIIKLGFRSGDKAPLAYLEFVDYKGDKKIAALKSKKSRPALRKTPSEKEKSTTFNLFSTSKDRALPWESSQENKAQKKAQALGKQIEIPLDEADPNTANKSVADKNKNDKNVKKAKQLKGKSKKPDTQKIAKQTTRPKTDTKKPVTKKSSSKKGAQKKQQVAEKNLKTQKFTNKKRKKSRRLIQKKSRKTNR